jgi:hypothetical protein
MKLKPFPPKPFPFLKKHFTSLNIALDAHQLVHPHTVPSDMPFLIFGRLTDDVTGEEIRNAPLHLWRADISDPDSPSLDPQYWPWDYNYGLTHTDQWGSYGFPEVGMIGYRLFAYCASFDEDESRWGCTSPYELVTIAVRDD